MASSLIFLSFYFICDAQMDSISMDCVLENPPPEHKNTFTPFLLTVEQKKNSDNNRVGFGGVCVPICSM